MIDDGELLRRYVEEDSEASFTELVQRHIDTVHAIAMRRGNGDSHFAADITQKVFIALARHARELTRHPAITGWLYTTTRYAVLDALRGEIRRTRREEEAFVMTETATEPTAGTMKDELLLAALDELNAKDREIVLLRFFQGYAFRQIGNALRLQEDAARRRVDRALVRLRAILERRGITSTAAALAGALAENTGLGAPVGLSLQITRAALAAGPASVLTLGGIYTLLVSAKAQLILATATTLLLGGLSYNQGLRNRQLESSLVPILVERSVLAERLAIRRTAALATTAELPPFRTTTTTTAPDPAAALRAQLEARPDKMIPEIELLSAGDWQSLASVLPPAQDENRLLLSFRSIRDRARSRFALMAVDALRRYSALNAGALPGKFQDLAAYFDEPVAPEILARYVLLRSGNYEAVSANDFVVGEIAGVVDDTGDSIVRFGRTPQSIVTTGGDGLGARVLRAVNLYVSEHQGAYPAKVEELLPAFASTELPAAQTALERITARLVTGAAPARLLQAPALKQ